MLGIRIVRLDRHRDDLLSSRLCVGEADVVISEQAIERVLHTNEHLLRWHSLMARLHAELLERTAKILDPRRVTVVMLDRITEHAQCALGVANYGGVPMYCHNAVCFR